MSESGHGEVAQALLPEPFDCAQQIAALRESGARQLDPVRFHYLEVLRARAQMQQVQVKGILEEKLALAVAHFTRRLAQAQQLIQSTGEEPMASLQTPTPRGETLGELVLSMTQAEPEPGSLNQQASIATGPELKSVRLFRSTWSKLSADKQLNAALDQAPKNAGPINSHMLVLRSLALMRDISPDYLRCFISYVDTLVHLEQSEKSKVAMPKIEADGQGGKKLKVRRAR